MTSVIEMIMAKATVRMNEALERLKAKIVSKLSEEVVEELGDINVSSFAKKSLKALEQDMIDIKTKGEEEEGTAPKAKKAKSSKDPNAPKGAKNAYIIFCADNRDQIKAENPEMNAKDIISEVARLWKETDEDVKAKYQEKAAEDKKRYDKEMSKYVPSNFESPKVKKGKSPKDPNAPKGAKNAYIIFCADNRDQIKTENPEMNAKEIISQMARLWKGADEDVKAEYQEKAAEDKKRYQQEMSDASDEDGSKKVEKVEKGKVAKGKSPKKDPNAPKGAKNAYIIFCADNRNQVKTDNPEMNAKEIISELARLWKEADEDVKAEYQEKATEDKKRYQEEMSDYASDEDEAKKVESPKKGSKKAGSKEAEVKEVEAKVESPKKGSKKGSKEAEVEKVESSKKGSKAKTSKAKKSDDWDAKTMGF